MKLISRLLFTTYLLLLTGSASFVGAQICGNNNQGGPGGDGDPNGTGGDPFQVYTGNDLRNVKDLQVWGGVGEFPLSFVRYGNSRAVPTSKPTFGDGHCWRHNFLWEMSTASNDSLGRARVNLIYPDGTNNTFTQISPAQWLSTPNVTDIIFPDPSNSNNLILQNKQGWQYHFIKVGSSFQMQFFTDSKGNTYNFTYNGAGAVTQVTEPGGRYLTITYASLTENVYGTATLATISSTPTAGAWTTITVSNPYQYPYLSYLSADNKSGNIAEVQFFANGSTTPLSGTFFGSAGSSPTTDYTKAFDGDTTSYFQAADVTGGFVGLKLPSAAPTSMQIKFYPRAGFESSMVGGKFQASTAYPKTISVVSQVQSSDGRTITYNYTKFTDPSLPTSYQTLTSVSYDDGTQATYNYGQSIPGTRPLMAEASDPRIGLKATFPQIHNQYQSTDSTVVGFVKTQTEVGTGVTLASSFTAYGPSDIRISYPGGRTVHFNVDHNNGRIDGHTDAAGKVEARVYDQSGYGFETSYSDKLGRTWQRVPSAHDNPMSRTFPDGKAVSWTRDTLDLPLTYTDALGRVTTYTRDSQHRITRIDYPDSSYETFTYNSFNEALTHRLRNGGNESAVYDGRGLKTSATDALGHTTTYTYNALDQLASSTDANGHTTQYQYNGKGLVTQVTKPDGSTLLYAYDAYGNKTSSTNEIGKTTTFTYDSHNRVLAGTDPLSRTTQSSYASPYDELPSLVTLPSGKLTQRTFDSLFRVSSMTVGYGTADAATTSYTYNSVGSVTKTTDARGHFWTYAYDNRNRKTSQTDPLGHTTTYTYDAVGNVLTTTRPDGGVTTNTYDSMNHLLTSTDPKGQVTTYTYDAAGNVSTMTDARSNTYTYSYDLLNRCTSLHYPDGSAESYGYDAVGNMISYTTRAGQVKTSVFDNCNREVSYTWSDSTPGVSRTYDATGRLITSDNGISASTYTYDNANQLLSEAQANVAAGATWTVGYSYDLDGNRASLTYPSGITVGYGYTNRNQVNAIASGGSNVATYTYDATGNALTKNLGNGTVASYTYDNANRLTAVNHTLAGASIARFDYGYDSVNRRTYERRDSATGDVFGYDAVDQVTGVNYEATNPTVSTAGATRTVGYAYDATGNRTSLTDSVNGNTSYTANNLNQYTAVNGSTYSYDGDGNVIGGNGTYLYDAQNRLETAQVGATTDQLYYDSKNRVVQREINGTPTFFIYDGWDLIEERDATNAVLASYIHGVRQDEMLSKTTPAGTIYYHHNALGSVTDLTNSSGTVVEKYKYDVYGKPSIQDGSGNPLTATAYGNRFLFTGREYLAEVGLYDYRNRVYSAELGRFLQTDPMSFSGGDVNIYRYCGNNCLNHSDPMGLTTLSFGITVNGQGVIFNGQASIGFSIDFSGGLSFNSTLGGGGGAGGDLSIGGYVGISGAPTVSDLGGNGLYSGGNFGAILDGSFNSSISRDSNGNPYTSNEISIGLGAGGDVAGGVQHTTNFVLVNPTPPPPPTPPTPPTPPPPPDSDSYPDFPPGTGENDPFPTPVTTPGQQSSNFPPLPPDTGVTDLPCGGGTNLKNFA